MRLLLFALILSLIGGSDGRRKLWSEDDENKYLADLKERELREFENEMKQQSEQRGFSSAKKYSLNQLGFSPQSTPFESSDLPNELRPPKMERKTKIEKPQYEALRAPKIEMEVSQNVDTDDENDYWCYHCATPIDQLRTDMRKSIRKLLEMRRTTFPKDAVTPECLSARNMTKLKKQKCSYKYCQSLSILDRNAGNAFVVRGCAEYFGAINVEEMEKKPDHSCDMLHEKLEIKECICKSSQYCHAGWKKRSASSGQRQSNLYAVLIFTTIAFVLTF